MSTEIETTVIAPKVDVTDQLKAMLVTLNEQASQSKIFMSNIRNVIKDVERQAKELDKLRNKKTRVKTERSPDALPSGITKPVAISDELAKFLGVAPGTLVPRNEVTKGVSGFVKKNELSDPTNKQRFILDNREPAKQLRALLGNPSEDVTYFNLQRYLKHHYIGEPATPAAKKAPKSVTPVAVPVAAQTPVAAEPEKKKVMKKVLVTKKKSELSEEA